MTAKKLMEFLNKHSIPYEIWGNGTAKTFEHLLKELNNAESKLVETENGLVRIVSLIVLDVYFSNGEKNYKLYEDRQVYKNGRIVKRDLQISVAEKLLHKEEPDIAVKRALAEELGITTKVTIINKGTTFQTIPEKSYPGLINQGTLYNYEAYLSKEQYKKEGYIEIQADKTSYFIWHQQ